MKIRELLSDGAWHRRDEVIVKAGVFIQPGIAIRTRERSRKRLVARREQQGKQPVGERPRSHEYQIAIGRKHIVVDILNTLAGLEHKVDNDGIRWVRDTRPAPKEPHHQ